MKVLGKVFKYLLILLIALAALAYLIPKQQHVERNIEINSPASTIFPYLVDYSKFNLWSPWADIDPEGTVYEFSGPVSGVGAKMSWASEHREVGSGSQEITAVSGSRVETFLDFGPQGTATSYISLDPNNGKTNVTWGFDTDMGNNPIGRWMGLLMDKWVGASFEKGLTKLKKLAENDMTTGSASTAISSNALSVAPPVAVKKPKELSIHGDTRIDDYFWLRDDERKDPEVLAYLEAENKYFETKTAHTKDLENSVFEEIVGRIKQDDSSVPVKIDNYWYYTRYAEGQEYPIYARKKGSLDANEEIMLNANELAKPHDYYNINNWDTTDDHKILAYAEDTVSRRQYDIRFKNLATGENLNDKLTNTSGAMAWSADGKYLFYVKKDEQTLLPFQVWRHQLGQSPDEDTLIYEEKDNTFYTSVGRSKSEDYIYIYLGSTVSSEMHLLKADDPTGKFTVFLPRERDHEYSVEDVDGRMFILTNWQAENFRVMETTLANASDRSKWKEIVAHREDAFIHAMDLTRDFLVLNERVAGLRQLRVLPLSDKGKEFVIESDEPAYASYLDDNVDINSTVLRYYYTSPTTPGTVYDYNMLSGERQLLKQDEVVDDKFAPANYQTERFSIKARDGAMVPVSVVYRKNMGELNTRPLLVYAYGSYGYSMDPTFSISRLSLLDRGFVYAIAHTRGGQELGRKWYDDGKMFNKKNTFTDFVDVTKALKKKSYGNPKRVYAYGGSAGGLLMGAILNMAPEEYHGVIAAVPFVDVVSTMLDESIPLTTGEFDEWGNPKIKEQYEYMKSYSPYDQVSAQEYPNLLIVTGLHDSQVQYWEPAKWIAKLRDMKTDDNLLLMHTDMESGHGGASGRFKGQRDTARNFAFLIDMANSKTQ